MSSTTGKYCITASLRCLFLLRDPTLKKENISDTLLQYSILSNVVVSLSTALPVMNHILRNLILPLFCRAMTCRGRPGISHFL